MSHEFLNAFTAFIETLKTSKRSFKSHSDIDGFFCLEKFKVKLGMRDGHKFIKQDIIKNVKAMYRHKSPSNCFRSVEPKKQLRHKAKYKSIGK